MHRELLKALIQSVELRRSQGDCPTEKAHSVETLEEMIIELVDMVRCGLHHMPIEADPFNTFRNAASVTLPDSKKESK